jgi:hypothetical protein
VDEPGGRRRRVQETLEAIRRADPRRNPTSEDIAHLHDVHARHEREAGREDRAEAAEERARQAREHGRHPPDS